MLCVHAVYIYSKLEPDQGCHCTVIIYVTDFPYDLGRHMLVHVIYCLVLYVSSDRRWDHDSLDHIMSQSCAS